MESTANSSGDEAFGGKFTELLERDPLGSNLPRIERTAPDDRCQLPHPDNHSVVQLPLNDLPTFVLSKPNPVKRRKMTQSSND
jgi:hypothetical protein